MKKTMILALAVLGMVLGSFAVVQPVSAQTVNCDPVLEDPSGCMIYECSDGCLLTACPQKPIVKTC